MEEVKEKTISDEENIKRLMELILEDVNETERESAKEYLESLKNKDADYILKDIDSAEFMVNAILITRYINELFSGKYNKSYLEIEKLLDELPLDKCFFYDSKLLEEFNRCVYLFVLFEAANNRYSLLANQSIAGIVNKEVYKRVLELKNEEYVPYDLYMAIKDLSKNKSKDMFLDRTLLLNLYYYELNITHISKIEIKNVEGEYMEELSNLNAHREKLKSLKKPHIIRRTIGGAICAIGLCATVLITGGIMKKLWNTPSSPMFTNDKGKTISSNLLVDETEMGLYITEYIKTDDGSYIVNEYKISDEVYDDKYYNKLDNEKLYKIELTDDMLIKSKRVSADDMQGLYYENKDSYRTVAKVYSSYNPESAALFTIFPLALVWAASLGGLALLEEFEKEYKETKTLTTGSLEKLKNLLAKIRNTVLINNPGTLNVEELEEQSFRI